MLIYNSLSRSKVELKKPLFRQLKLFVCGPTVYDYSHIGHGRTYVAFDLFVRHLRSRGFKVFYLQNITDIDDKIIARAKETNQSPKELAGFFYKKHLLSMEALGVDSVTKYAPATGFIPEIVKQVLRLKEKGYAYEIPNDGIYYDISKFKDYGKLSGRTVAQAEDGVSRIDESVKKRNKGDFCLWKFYSGDRAEPFWETELGDGRPGWHIEDTAISEKFFGPQYDIHGGAVDLKFPHHEAEIAEQEAASGKVPFVRIWMHTGFLFVNGEKMSKSLKNFISIPEFLEKYPAEVFRFLVLGHHYRSPFDYSEDLAEQTQLSLLTIKEFLGKLDFVIEKNTGKNEPIALEGFEKAFGDALEDDFNTPEALAALFKLINANQKNLWDLDKRAAKALRSSIESKLKVFGFEIKKEEIPGEVKKIAGERELFRENKQFDKADVLRKKIEGLGYRLEDTPLGPFVKKLYEQA